MLLLYLAVDIDFLSRNRRRYFFIKFVYTKLDVYILSISIRASSLSTSLYITKCFKISGIAAFSIIDRLATIGISYYAVRGYR